MNNNPDSILVKVPSSFYVDDDTCKVCLNNLPPSDYDPDGGFIGRKDDLNKLKALLISNLDRVITIIGAGGVGKTAIAHKFCYSLLTTIPCRFEAVVWISAKEETLTSRGIEPIEVAIRDYEQVLEEILRVFSFYDSLRGDLQKKIDDVDLILNASDKGILLVVDNLETIKDERIIEFIKNIPQPNKVLITSRMGLGEIERRYPLRELSRNDAITLIRTISHEKGVDTLAKLSDEILHNYAQKMASYPLVIKWIIGQVAAGGDLDQLIDNLISSSGDIAKFCFDHIYENLLSQHARLILDCLAISDNDLTRGVLTHISNLQSEELDQAIRELTLASLINSSQERGPKDNIITKYSLLSLTIGYINSKLEHHPEIRRVIQDRIQSVSVKLEYAVKAGQEYRYALNDLGANTDEEKIASTYAISAFQRYMNYEYAAATDLFIRAQSIAPQFARLYRNWAMIESLERHYDRANNLMEKAVKLSPKDATLWFSWANIEKAQSHLDRSQLYYLQALELSPNDGAILNGLGEVAKRSGKYAEADIYFQRAIKIPTELTNYKNEVINLTSLADNYRRWSEELSSNSLPEQALEKAFLAYDFAQQACDLTESDDRALFTLQETAFQLARLVLFLRGIEESIPYFKEAIIPYAKKVKERKVTALACILLIHALIKEGRITEAKEYFKVGDKARLGDITKDYEKLHSELFDLVSGFISSISRNGSYAFIERTDLSGSSIFVHFSSFIPTITADTLAGLKGEKVTFLIKTTYKGPEAVNVILATALEN